MLEFDRYSLDGFDRYVPSHYLQEPIEFDYPLKAKLIYTAEASFHNQNMLIFNSLEEQGFKFADCGVRLLSKANEVADAIWLMSLGLGSDMRTSIPSVLFALNFADSNTNCPAGVSRLHLNLSSDQIWNDTEWKERQSIVQEIGSQSNIQFTSDLSVIVDGAVPTSDLLCELIDSYEFIGRRVFIDAAVNYLSGHANIEISSNYSVLQKTQLINKHFLVNFLAGITTVSPTRFLGLPYMFHKKFSELKGVSTIMDLARIAFTLENWQLSEHAERPLLILSTARTELQAGLLNKLFF